MMLPPYERELRAAREAWTLAQTRATYRIRTRCERLVSQRTRHGGRQARASSAWEPPGPKLTPWRPRPTSAFSHRRSFARMQTSDARPPQRSKAPGPTSKSWARSARPPGTWTTARGPWARLP
jgi:hypothetical protein